MRAPSLPVLLVAACTAAVCVVGWLQLGAAPAPWAEESGQHVPSVAAEGSVVSSSRAARRSAAVGALGILHRWDRQRAAAYARGDSRTLRRLYVPGSTAGVADVRLLRSYARRGLSVVEMRTQVLKVRLLRRTGSLLRLRVEDRLVGVRVEPRARLPADTPSVRVLTLVRGIGGWRMRTVRNAGEVSAGRPRAGR